MSDWILAGRIYEKNVFFKRININYDFSKDLIQNSTLMICFEDSTKEIKQVKLILDHLALGSPSPLLVQICGKNSEKYFDHLLEKLSRKNHERHTMTLWSDEDNINEWLVDFFECAYPSEERFDEWNEYRVLVLCGELVSEKILNSIKAYLSE
jgi:hypothetical protein